MIAVMLHYNSLTLLSGSVSFVAHTNIEIVKEKRKTINYFVSIFL